jgi:hypothetical protein
MASVVYDLIAALAAGSLFPAAEHHYGPDQPDHAAVTGARGSD